MSEKTIGQQLDEKLDALVTKDHFDDKLRAAFDAHTKSIIGAVNAAIEGLRVDLNKAGVPVKTAARGDLNKH